MSTRTDTEAQVLDLERDFWLQGGSNPGFWQENCAEEAIIALPMGILSKSETVAAMESSQPWETVQFDDIRTVSVSDTVIVSYKATARREGALDDYLAVVSSAYAPMDGKWLLVFHQQSPTG